MAGCSLGVIAVRDELTSHERGGFGPFWGAFPNTACLATMAMQGRVGVAMRPDKRINPNAHRSGGVEGKNRHYTTGLPRRHEGDGADTSSASPQLEVPSRPDPVRDPVPDKYSGRASVTPKPVDEAALAAIELKHKEWVDPLDDDGIDLTAVTIDLRDEMRDDPPPGYYQRHSSKVPGRN